MHAPRPYGLFYRGDELDGEDRQAVESLARTVSNLKTVAGLPAFKRVITLPSGRVATALDMGGVFKILVSDKYAAPDFEPDGLVHDYVPMLFSGAVENGLPKRGDGVPLRLTEMCRRRLVAYQPDPKTRPLPPKRAALRRFEIAYPLHLRHLALKNAGIFSDTQYFKMRPGWHSGTMAEVVQTVAGYGRQDFAELPDKGLERAVMVLPDKVASKVRAEMGKARLPAYTGFPNAAGQLAYSYVHGLTDAVGFDAERGAWLLRVGRNGVFAMPLPLIPATATQAFRRYVEQVGDSELLYLLDRFGGMPSGETFPQGADFEAWRRAGCIIKICDCADFYNFSPMYEAGGWSFNEYASEGFNTCFEYDGRGVMMAYGYKLRLKLAPVRQGGWLDDGRDKLSPQERRALDGYLSAILAQFGNDAAGLAVRYKLRRVPVADILRRAAAMVSVGAEKEYWDNLTLPPIAAHSGNMARVSAGAVYHDSRYVKALPALKFPTLDAQGCASLLHDMGDYIKNGGKPLLCDTVVFGCYVHNRLEVIKYFYDERTFVRETESTFEEPMIVGQWEKTETVGESGLMGRFYTTSFDDRAEAAPQLIYTKVTGRDLGYGQPLYATPGIFDRVGQVVRSRYYSTTTETDVKGGFSLATAVCVPVFARDCVHYAYADGTGSRSWTLKSVLNSMADPYSYQMWTHDDIWHFRGTTKAGNKGDPPPRDGKPVYVDSELYQPTEFSDYADSGPWMGTVTDITGIVGRYTARGSDKQVGGALVGGEAPRFKPRLEKKQWDGERKGKVCVAVRHADAQTVHRELPHPWFFDVSPVMSGGSLSYFFRDAAANYCGQAAYANINEFKPDGRRYAWGVCSVADVREASFLIGVVNE